LLVKTKPQKSAAKAGGDWQPQARAISSRGFLREGIMFSADCFGAKKKRIAVVTEKCGA